MDIFLIKGQQYTSLVLIICIYEIIVIHQSQHCKPKHVAILVDAIALEPVDELIQAIADLKQVSNHLIPLKSQ